MGVGAAGWVSGSQPRSAHHDSLHKCQESGGQHSVCITQQFSLYVPPVMMCIWDMVKKSPVHYHHALRISMHRSKLKLQWWAGDSYRESKRPSNSNAFMSLTTGAGSIQNKNIHLSYWLDLIFSLLITFHSHFSFPHIGIIFYSFSIHM